VLAFIFWLWVYLLISWSVFPVMGYHYHKSITLYFYRKQMTLMGGKLGVLINRA